MFVSGGENIYPGETRSQGPFLSQHYPASTVIRPRPTPAMAAAFATLRPLPSPLKQPGYQQRRLGQNEKQPGGVHTNVPRS